MTTPVRVAVTGAAGSICYSVLFRIASGEMLGKDQPIILQLIEIPPAMGALEGVVMEISDCAFDTLAGVEITDDPNKGFDGANVAILVGGRPRGPGPVGRPDPRGWEVSGPGGKGAPEEGVSSGVCSTHKTRP